MGCLLPEKGNDSEGPVVDQRGYAKHEDKEAAPNY